MIAAGSRYEAAEQQFALAHKYNEWGLPILEEEDPNVKVLLDTRSTLYMLETAPVPVAPPMEYFVKQDEGYHFLAYKFLGDCRRWPELADVNNDVWYPLDLKTGDYIRVLSS